MKDFNEEDYLDSLLKSMDKKVEESDEDKQERLIEEQIKEAVEKTKMQSIKDKVTHYDKKDSNEGLNETSSIVGTNEFGKEFSKKDSIEEAATAKAFIEETATAEAFIEKAAIAEAFIEKATTEEVTIEEAATEEVDIEEAATEEVDIEEAATEEVDIEEATTEEVETIASKELGEEYNKIFESEDRDFKISDIPDREPAELTQSEIDRLANMNLDGLFEDVVKDSVSVEELLGSSNDSADELFESSDSDSTDNNSNSDLDDHESLESELVAAAATAAMVSKKKSKEKKKSKNGKKFNVLKFIKNIFIEELIQADEATDKSINENIELNELNNIKDLANIKDATNLLEPKNENERVLQELYGSDVDGALLDDNESNPKQKSVKNGFFANIKAKFSTKKAKAAQQAKAEEEAEELEFQEKNKVKETKKAAVKEKKDQAKNTKAAKPPKPAKAKKEKKPKEPVRPEDMLKLKPKSLVVIVSLVSGVVILVQVLNSTFYYNNDVNNARLYFQNGNYQKAYDCIQGVDLKPIDQQLYDQITTIMYVEKQYTSYQHYVELGMGVEALNSLVKGIQRYYTYSEIAKELGVSEQLNATKVEIVNSLKIKFSISEEKAISYASLSEENFTQYYLTLESYGGLVGNDSNN